MWQNNIWEMLFICNFKGSEKTIGHLLCMVEM